ncbi:MAG: hypothetical protein ACOCUT_01660 [bacterium]
MDIKTKKIKIGKVLSTWYQIEEDKYDRVKIKNQETGDEEWLDTTRELPEKNRMVIYRQNKKWFNDYDYLDEE